MGKAKNAGVATVQKAITQVCRIKGCGLGGAAALLDSQPASVISAIAGLADFKGRADQELGRLLIAPPQPPPAGTQPPEPVTE